MEGTGLTGRGTGMALGTENPIRIRTRGTLTRVPAGYIRTRVQHYTRQKFEPRTYIELHCRYTLIHPGDDLLCNPAGGGGERCEKSKAYSTGST